MSLSEEVHSNNYQESEVSSGEVFIDCPYCDISPKGLVWIQCHLAGTGGEILPCLKIPSLIRSTLKADLLRNGVEDMDYSTNQENLHADENEKELNGNGRQMEREALEEDIKNENEKNHNADKIDNKLNGNGNHVRVEPSEEDNLSRLEKKEFIKIPVGMFLYENGLDSNVLNSPSFQKLISRKPEHRKGIPTPQEFKDNLKEMEEYIVGVRESWIGTGCSILLDGWADKKGRRLMNVLADCPRGTLYLSSHDITDFVEDMDAMISFVDQIISGVGLSNVVQIITNSTSDFMVELGKRLMVKYRPIFWTVSISSCIDLMLEKMSDLDIIKRTLESTKLITRFIHSRPEVLKRYKVLSGGYHPVRPSKKSCLPFSTLKNIVLNEQSLKTIFLSDMSLSLTLEGKKVADLVLGQSFWSDAVIVVKATIPLVLVMNWMDRNKSHMGYIYETLDQAKEKIRDGIEEVKSKMGDTQKRKYGYKKFWEVVDDVWNNIFHSPIHSGGYFLNPEIFYSRDVNLDSEICLGMACCAVRYTEVKKTQDVIILLLEYYQYSLGKFEKGHGIKERKAVSPAIWWRTYAGDHPELQRLAVRIESQTCDGASRYHLKRSLAEDLLTEGRDPVEQNKLKQKVFFKYNMELKSFVPGMRYSPTADDTDLMNDWTMGKSQK